MRFKRTVTILGLLLVLLQGCDFQKQADAQFGDQHFKTAISLIELHKVRFGSYPNNLKELKFIGDWDRIALNSVTYERVDDGYTLNVTRGWVGKPSLHYPDEFWIGLGIKHGNKSIQPTAKKAAEFNYIDI